MEPIPLEKIHTTKRWANVVQAFTHMVCNINVTVLVDYYKFNRDEQLKHIRVIGVPVLQYKETLEILHGCGVASAVQVFTPGGEDEDYPGIHLWEMAQPLPDVEALYPE